MLKLYRILGFLALLVILTIIITFAFGLFLVGVAVASLVGLYRYYSAQKGFRDSKIKSKSNGYLSDEIIDMPAEDRK